MRGRKEHFRHILLFYYRKDKNAVQIRKKLREDYGEGVHNGKLVKLFKFRFDNFDVKDAPLYGRSVEVDEDKTKTLIEANTDE